MSATPSSATSGVGAVIRVLMVFDTVALLFAGTIHIGGVSIPLGSAVFNEPQMVYAATVEELAGLIFLVGTYAVFARKAWAWTSAIVAHVFAILGFILGLIATRNGTSPFNYTYHRVMLVIFVLGFILLLLPVGQAALGRGRQVQ